MTTSVSGKPASEPEHGASRAEKKVAIVTGASQGIGAGIAAAFSSEGYAVVGAALSVEPSATPDVLMISGDIAQAETAELVVQQGLDRFGRIDTLVNNAGIYIGKPFTDYTVDDYMAITSVNLTGFFHMTQRAIAQMVAQGGRPRRQCQHQSRRARGRTGTVGPCLADQGRTGGGDALSRHRVRRTGRPRQCGGARHHRDPPSRPGFVP
jgi:NAD(P)-dependent dehydrogenase (short-subunit alcohol dehydrogenase family)